MNKYHYLQHGFSSNNIEYSYRICSYPRSEFMHYFLTYGRQLTQEELDALDEDEKAVKKTYPTLAQFKEQIDYYENIHDQLKNLETTKIFQVLMNCD